MKIDLGKNELIHFEINSAKNKDPLTNGKFCLDILKIFN